MKNCLIMGSGRSGTSMVTGALASAGYFMGEQLYQARDSNPKGFYEDREVNLVNELLLAQVLPFKPWFIGHLFYPERVGRWQRWLACLQPGVTISTSAYMQVRIQKLLTHEPYCFKDPRLSYTLPAWRPYLKDTVFVCVFRDPAITATSILKECRDVGYLKNLKISFEYALNMWLLMYTHILQIHAKQGEWLFLHYNQVLTPEGLDRLESFTGAPVDRTFPDTNLRRSTSEQPIPDNVRLLYNQLCECAAYHD